MHHWWRPLLEEIYLQAGTSPRPCYTSNHKLHIEVSMEAKCDLLCQYGSWWTASTKEQLMTMHTPPDNLNQNVPTCEMQSGASICNVLNRGRWPIWQVKLGLFLWEHSNSRLSSVSDEIEVVDSLMLTISDVSAGRHLEISPAHYTHFSSINNPNKKYLLNTYTSALHESKQKTCLRWWRAPEKVVKYFYACALTSCFQKLLMSVCCSINLASFVYETDFANSMQCLIHLSSVAFLSCYCLD